MVGQIALSTLLHGTKLEGALENRAVQEDLNRLKKWVNENLMQMLNRLTQCAVVMEKGNYILGCVCKINMCGPMSYFGSPIQDRHWHTALSPLVGKKDGHGTEVADVWGEAEEAGFVQSPKGKWKGNFMALCIYLNRGSRKDSLSFVVCGGRRRGSRCDLQIGQFQLNTMEKKIKIMRVVKHWNRLTREIVESLLSMIFKTCLEETLSSWI